MVWNLPWDKSCVYFFHVICLAWPQNTSRKFLKKGIENIGLHIQASFSVPSVLNSDRAFSQNFFGFVLFDLRT